MKWFWPVTDANGSNCLLEVLADQGFWQAESNLGANQVNAGSIAVAQSGQVWSPS